MYVSSLANRNQTAKSSKFRRQFHIAALRFVLNKALQALKENPNDCYKTYFNITNFHRFHVHLFKHFSPQLIDQTDYNSIIKILLILLLNRNHSLDSLHELNDTDVEKI